ncbi:Homoserine O-succinyltransferase [hydrothermal vent metagenome]|uniref:Homoserine O-succinyltransferase n=1 Tax=hydrothermal vent metagenome TaxID=652676 RepID=A0A1W1CWH1_9ZZZZ
MSLIAYSDLPTFARLKQEGEFVLSKKEANKQTIRELHIGLLNLMPDAALEATERQFFRLVNQSNKIAQFFIHPFSLKNIKREEKTIEHIKNYYQDFEEIKGQGLDALIITGANVSQPDLEKEPFYQELGEVIEWAYQNVASTLCSCLATHAVLQFKYQQKRQLMNEKCWGVFPHKVIKKHPLVNGINTVFNLPHSRFNEITKQQFQQAKLSVLVDSDEGIHLAVSEDLIRLVFLQGHPEYDTISLLKEYKREVDLFLRKKNPVKPVFPKNYLNTQAKAILDEFIETATTIENFPEDIIAKQLDNSWHDSALAIMNNWVGCVYQITHYDRKKHFMDGVDKNDPLKLK